MKTKDQSTFNKQFYAYVETQLHCSMKTIRSYNARELCEDEALHYSQP